MLRESQDGNEPDDDGLFMPVSQRATACCSVGFSTRSVLCWTCDCKSGLCIRCPVLCKLLEDSAGSSVSISVQMVAKEVLSGEDTHPSSENWDRILVGHWVGGALWEAPFQEQGEG